MSTLSKPNPTPPSPSREPIRVLVADDSAFMRQALSRLLASDPAIKVIDTARDGKEALDKAKTHKPHVITLDIEMPNVDGLAALRAIKRECNPAPAVLMCSSLTTAGSHAALTALRFGAADVIAKDASNVSLHMDDMRDELLAKIKAIAPSWPSPVGSGGPSLTPFARPADNAPAPIFPLSPSHRFKPDEFDLILIGSSTGGPPVLETIIPALPASLNCPVIIAQHMPVLFTKSLAQRLSETAKRPVQHAEHGLSLTSGTIYMCPGGQHTHVNRNGTKLALTMSDEPKTELYKPGVNVLLSTAAKACPGRILAIVLTGMGDDGGRGAAELRARGHCTIIAQEAKSCVVYGMPRAVVTANAADLAATPDQIATMLASLGAAKAAA